MVLFVLPSVISREDERAEAVMVRAAFEGFRVAKVPPCFGDLKLGASTWFICGAALGDVWCGVLG